MGKGVLLELEGRQAIVLTPQGEFKRVPTPAGTWDVGDEIEFGETQPSLVMRWAKVAAVAAAVFLAVLAPWAYGSIYLPTQVMAIVTVDINPSLELGVNNQGNVIRAQGLNADGKAVLQGVSWERRPLADVIKGVTERAIEAQKLNPADDAGAVLVAVAPAGSKELPAATADRLATDARAAAEAVVAAEAEAQGQTPKAHVSALKATVAEKAEAEKVGLNPGQYMLYKEIQTQVPTVKPEDVKGKGPGKLMKELGLSPSDVFSKAEEHAGPKSGGKPDSKSDDKSDDKSGSKSGDKAKPDENPGNSQGGRPPESGQEPKGNAGEKNGNQSDRDNGSEARENQGGSDSKGNGSGKGDKESERQSGKSSEADKPKDSSKGNGSSSQEDRKQQERQSDQQKGQQGKGQQRDDQSERREPGKVSANGDGQPDSRATEIGIGPPVPPPLQVGAGQRDGPAGGGREQVEERGEAGQADGPSDKQPPKTEPAQPPEQKQERTEPPEQKPERTQEPPGQEQKDADKAEKEVERGSGKK